MSILVGIRISSRNSWCWTWMVCSPRKHLWYLNHRKIKIIRNCWKNLGAF